jgi:polysaccharide biosynthesis protein VpsQ
MTRLQKLTFIYGLVIVVIIILANNGDLPIARLMRILPYSDKLGHFFLIGLLGLLLNLSLNCRKWGFFLIGSLLVGTFATLEEVSQLYSPHRTFDIGDLAADYLGLLVFGFLATFLCKNNKTPNPP